MNRLTQDEKRRLIEAIREDHPPVSNRASFEEVLHRLLDDLPGFEMVSNTQRTRLIAELWRTYTMGNTKKSEPAKVTMTLDKECYQQAITAGRAALAEGKTKADAAMIMYLILKDEPRDQAVEALVQGASLTPKGAMTYWYNCKRKVRRAA